MILTPEILACIRIWSMQKHINVCIEYIFDETTSKGFDMVFIFREPTYEKVWSERLNTEQLGLETRTMMQLVMDMMEKAEKELVE